MDKSDCKCKCKKKIQTFQIITYTYDPKCLASVMEKRYKTTQKVQENENSKQESTSECETGNQNAIECSLSSNPGKQIQNHEYDEKKDEAKLKPDTLKVETPSESILKKGFGDETFDSDIEKNTNLTQGTRNDFKDNSNGEMIHITCKCSNCQSK